MKRVLGILLPVILLGLVACGAAGGPTGGSDIQITDAWARPSPMGGEMGGEMSGGMGGGNGAVYMIIKNGGSVADKLVRAQSDVAKTVELHTVQMEGDVMQMRPVEFIEVPANGQVELKPGGFHVMLLGLNKELKPGESVKVKLTFDKAGEKEIQAVIREQ